MRPAFLIGMLLGLAVSAGPDIYAGKRKHTTKVPSGTKCKTHEDCDLNFLCEKWTNGDKGLGYWCVAGCRDHGDCKPFRVCAPSDCESRPCPKYCHYLDVVESK